MHMEEHLVFYPAPAIGHLVSMVELAKRFSLHHRRYHLTVILVKPPFDSSFTAPYIRRISAAYPSISFHYLPPVALPHYSPSPPMEVLIFEFINLNNPLLHDALRAISGNAPVRAFILDLFCHSALDVAAQLNIPPYFFFTSGAAALAVFLHLPTIHNTTSTSLGDLPRDATIDVPGVPSLPAHGMPRILLDRHSEGYRYFLETATCVAVGSNGILVNTFELLEPRAVRALLDRVCVPDRPTPPVYALGPLIDSGDRSCCTAHECLAWLDSQPPKSVVFLCFGSMGLFSSEQLKEIATGLERSGHRFLWVVRSPPLESGNNMICGMLPPEPDLDELLPEGFLERTRDRGMVVKSWAPQVAVLGREAVGGFVTHCGWNSILEAVGAGVPMAAWPLYAEQRMNRVFLVEEMKIAIPVIEDENGFVVGEEVERRVRELMMGSEEGRRVKGRTAEMKQAAVSAWEEGGSSRRAMAELVQSWKQ